MNLEKINLDSIELKELNRKELNAFNGGETGDAAYWIGRTYVWSVAHILTGGLSSVYLIGKNL